MALIESTKNGKPQYRVRWNYRRDEHGKQVYDERRFASKADARRFDRLKDAATTADTERITVSQLADKWLTDHVDLALQMRTRLDYHTQVRIRIKPHLGRTRVAKLTPRVVTEWQKRMLETTSAKTANRSLDTLRAMIRWGRSKGYCANRMIDDTRKLQVSPPKPANPYTPAEIERITNGCKRMIDAAMIGLAAYSGLRWSELRALKWSDIDFDKRTIHLTRSLDADQSEKDTKTEGGRIVPILMPGMRWLLEWQKVAPDTDLVFTSSTGGPVSKRWYTDHAPGIRKASGIHFEPHQLRDTYASILIAADIGEAQLTLWLGHRSINTTLNRYGRLFEARRTHLAARADELLASGVL